MPRVGCLAVASVEFGLDSYLEQIKTNTCT